MFKFLVLGSTYHTSIWSPDHPWISSKNQEESTNRRIQEDLCGAGGGEKQKGMTMTLVGGFSPLWKIYECGQLWWWHSQYMGVSCNRGTPKSSILVGFSLINHPFLGTPMTMEPPIYANHQPDTNLHELGGKEPLQHPPTNCLCIAPLLGALSAQKRSAVASVCLVHIIASTSHMEAQRD